MHNENWDDLRFVLAVADHGSVSAAARALGVNHATVLRRVAAFEAVQGLAVFDKTPRGYTVAPAHRALIDALREVENAVHATERLLRGDRAPLRGQVRVTSTDTLCQTILPGLLAELAAEARDLKIELISANAHTDLARRQADIAVRPAKALPDDLTGEIAAELGMAVFGHDLGQPWLRPTGALARSAMAEWMAEHCRSDEIGGAADSFHVLAGLASAGMGRAILPCFVGTAFDLPMLECEPRQMRVPIWVASHTEIAHLPRIRVVRRHLVDGLAAMSDVLLGETRPPKIRAVVTSGR